MKNCPLEKGLFNRQYNDKWKFSDYNALIKKMECKEVLCFSNYHNQGDMQNNDVPISTCKFSHKDNEIAAIANENGIVCIQNVEKVSRKCYVQTHKNTVYDIAWMPGNAQFVTVSGDNSAKLWDCNESSVDLVSVFRGHKRSVRCVSFKPENTAVFATGSRDGSLMLWDARAQKKCAKFSHHLPDQVIPSGAGLSPGIQKFGTKKPGLSTELLNSKSVTGVVFQNDNTLISCGSLDNVVRIWDMRKTYSRSTSNSVAKYQLYSPYSGFSYLCMNSAQTKLYTNCMDSYIYCFNINSYDPEPVAAFYGHENGSFYIKSSISLDGKYLMSGSSDEIAYIWNTKDAEFSTLAVKPFVTLSSHIAEVTCVEMCPRNLVIVTCSDDGTFRLWNTLHTSDENKLRRIDRAECYDVKSTCAVKTQWKNKRKLDVLEKEAHDESPHTKICRFYSRNLSSICICHSKTAQKVGVKRPGEESLLDLNPAKRKAVIEEQEHTPPKHEEPKNIVPTDFESTVTLTKTNPPPLRLSSKRKLEDMPNFIEECNKTKKINCHRILSPYNVGIKSDKNVRESTTDESAKRPKLEFTVTVKENRRKFSILGMSSPTSNLPNYIEDGTSPYIHKCSRSVQKENDWLTKLKETRRAEKSSPEQRKLTYFSSTGEQQKKKSKANDQTLHRYFKVSSKTTDKSYNLQDIQKKSILI